MISGKCLRPFSGGLPLGASSYRKALCRVRLASRTGPPHRIKQAEVNDAPPDRMVAITKASPGQHLFDVAILCQFEPDYTVCHGLLTILDPTTPHKRAP